MTIKFQQLTTATGATTTAAVAAFGDALKALALTHSSWSLVEDVIVGTSNYRWIVLKCAATGSMPNDHYVALVLNPTGANFNAFSGEAYDTATHKLSGVCVQTTNTPVALDSSGRIPGASPSFSPNAIGGAAQSGSGLATGNSGSNYSAIGATTIYWWAGFYDDHLAFAVGITQAALASNAYYHGGYDSLVPTPAVNDPVRVVQAMIASNATTSSTNSYSAASREPLQLASTTRYWACGFNSPLSTGSGYEYGRASGSAPDAINSGAFAVTRLLLVGYSGLTSSSTADWHIRGRYSNVLYGAGIAAIAGIAPGDTISYGGTLWLFAGAGVVVDTGVAA